MFVDFDTVFDKKEKKTSRVPDAFINYLNRQLPAGAKYYVDANGNCVVGGDGADIKIGGYQYVLSEDDKKILGKKYTNDDVLGLFYNRQRPILLQPVNEKYILLNDQEFPLDKFVLNPYTPIDYKSGKLFLTPMGFPEPFQITVGCSEYDYTLTVHRVPNNSVSIAEFESEKGKPISIRYFVDQKKNTLSMSMAINISNAESVRDIVAAARIYNAFLEGKGLLGGTPLATKLSGDGIHHFEDNIAEFWGKVLKIEETLGVSFTIPEDEIDFDTICRVEQLYQNLINGNPIVERNKPESLDGMWEQIDEDDLKKSIGKPIFFEFEATLNIELFGVKLSLRGVVGIINASLSGLKKNKKKYKILLDDVDSEHPRHTVSIFFKSEDEMIAYKETDHNERIKSFQNAKMAKDHLA